VLDMAQANMELWGFHKLEVSGDGQRLLVVETARAPGDHAAVVLVENWLAEFNADR